MMKQQWMLKGRYIPLRVGVGGMAFEKRQGWLLECPAGHMMGITTSFDIKVLADDLLSVCCAVCECSYQVKLSY